jgi:hypothetical protein
MVGERKVRSNGLDIGLLEEFFDLADTVGTQRGGNL